MSGLKIWTFCRAICARRNRRMSSSLLPLNMLPAMTSIQPPLRRRPPPCGWSGEVGVVMGSRESLTGRHSAGSTGPRDGAILTDRAAAARDRASDARLVFARLGVDADLVAFVHERRHLDDQPRLERRRLHLRAGRRPFDAGHRLLDDEIHRLRQFDADRLLVVELDAD